METRLANKWLILGIDLLIVGICFMLAYLIRFNMSLNFDMSAMAQQLPVVLLITLLAFLIISAYMGTFPHSDLKEASNIFAVVALSGILLILFVVINAKWEIISSFTIPLSIIIIHSVLSFFGLTASRLLSRMLGNKVQRGLK